MDDAAEQIGARAPVGEGGPGCGAKRRTQDVASRVPGVIAVGVVPAVGDSRRHGDQVPDRDRFDTRRRIGCQVFKMGQDHIVLVEQALGLSDTKGYRGEGLRR